MVIIIWIDGQLVVILDSRIDGKYADQAVLW